MSEVWSSPVTITVTAPTPPTPPKISYTATVSADKTSGTAPLTVNFTMDVYFDKEVSVYISRAILNINGTSVTPSTASWNPVPSTAAYSKQWRLVTSYTFNNPGTYNVKVGVAVIRIADAQGNQYTLGYTEIWSPPATVKGLATGDWLAGVLTGLLAYPLAVVGIQKLKEWYEKRRGTPRIRAV